MLQEHCCARIFTSVPFFRNFSLWDERERWSAPFSQQGVTGPRHVTYIPRVPVDSHGLPREPAGTHGNPRGLTGPRGNPYIYTNISNVAILCNLCTGGIYMIHATAVPRGRDQGFKYCCCDLDCAGGMGGTLNSDRQEQKEQPQLELLCTRNNIAAVGGASPHNCQNTL